MMKTICRISAVFLLIFLGKCLVSQQVYKNYSIEYQKRTNRAKLYPQWEITDKQRKFQTERFLLTTNSEFSFYEKIIEEEDGKGRWNWQGTSNAYSTTYLNIEKKRQVSKKEVSELSLLLRDSIPQLEWHIMNEEREIAGYTCYKAIAKLSDSIDVVAYFTPQLFAPIGPESYSGLPGTILGLVVPKMHTTWLAQKVKTLELYPPDDFAPPRGGKKVNFNELDELLNDAYKKYRSFQAIKLRVMM